MTAVSGPKGLFDVGSDRSQGTVGQISVVKASDVFSPRLIVIVNVNALNY